MCSGAALTQIYRQSTLTAGQLNTQGHDVSSLYGCSCSRLILLLQTYLMSLQNEFYPIAKGKKNPVLQSLLLVSIKLLV